MMVGKMVGGGEKGIFPFLPTPSPLSAKQFKLTERISLSASADTH
jgi:hypothetical protein